MTIMLQYTPSKVTAPLLTAYGPYASDARGGGGSVSGSRPCPRVRTYGLNFISFGGNHQPPVVVKPNEGSACIRSWCSAKMHGNKRKQAYY